MNAIESRSLLLVMSAKSPTSHNAMRQWLPVLSVYLHPGPIQHPIRLVDAGHVRRLIKARRSSAGFRLKVRVLLASNTRWQSRCRVTVKTLATPFWLAKLMRWPPGWKAAASVEEDAFDNPLSTGYVLGPCDVLQYSREYVASTAQRAEFLVIHRHREKSHTMDSVECHCGGVKGKHHTVTFVSVLKSIYLFARTLLLCLYLRYCSIQRSWRIKFKI